MNVFTASIKAELWGCSAEVLLRAKKIKEIAEKYDLVFVPQQEKFDEAAKLAPNTFWLRDGVHPIMGRESVLIRFMRPALPAQQIDFHTLPFLCGVPDWDEITAVLHEIGYSGDLNFEAGNFLKPLPKELYPAGARMLTETGRYLVKMINREM